MTQTQDPTETPTETPADVAGTPWSDYVRSVTLVDNNPDDGQREPLHVSHRVLFNGEPTDVRVLLSGGYSITGGDTGTIVSFLVHPDDCSIGRIDRGPDGTDDPPRFDLPTIGGHKVLTPFPDPAWSTEHLIDPLRTAGTKPGYPAVLQHEWVRVHFYVAEVSCVRAPAEPAEPAEAPQ